jgi:hypothetical protein
MKRTAATRRTATRTSDRTFCFFRSLSQSSVSFGFRQAFLDLIKKVPSCLERIASIRVPQLFGTAYRLDWRGKRQASHRFEGHLTLTLLTGADPHTGHRSIISGPRPPLDSRWRFWPVPSPLVSSATRVRCFLPEPKSDIGSSWCHTGGISAWWSPKDCSIQLGGKRQSRFPSLGQV